MAKAAPAPLGAELLGVPKGAAAPAFEVPRAPPELASGYTSSQAAPPLLEEARTALTVRLPISTQERLREAAHRTRQEKQSIVDQALVAWLEARGY